MLPQGPVVSEWRPRLRRRIGWAILMLICPGLFGLVVLDDSSGAQAFGAVMIGSPSR